MTVKSLSVALVLTLAAATGCKKAAPAEHAVPTSTVDQVDHWIAADQCTPVDANNASTRTRMGVVPGAIQLTSYDQYNVSELPADHARRLIFYCANTQCGASHTAADRARVAGYTDVEVMPAGIFGWVDAGKKVDRI